MKRLFILLSIVIIASIMLMAAKNEYTRFLPSAGFGMPTLIQKGEVDYLFVGSSTFRKGLDIEELAQLDGFSYLLSYNGNQPVSMAMEIDYLLRKGVKIHHLFIDFYPYTAAAVTKLSDTRLLLDTDTQFKFELWNRLDEQAIASGKSLPDRFSTFFELFVSSNNTTILWWPIYRRANLSRNKNGGLTGLAQQKGSTKEQLDALDLFGKRDGLQQEQLHAYRHIIELAKQHHIKLHFLEIPKYHRLMSDDDYIALADEVNEYLLNSLHENPELSLQKDLIIRADQITIDTHDPNNFNDLIHLSGMGANAYSKQLVEWVKAMTP